ncbi:MAG: hypothetical protein AAF919_12430 [Pseudomonadota bacterium]
MGRILIRPIAVVAAFLAIGSALWAEEERHYSVVEAEIRAVLQVLATDTGQRIEVARGVSGRVADLELIGPTNAIFEALAEEAGLDWFVFDGVGYVSPESDGTSRLIRLGDLGYDQTVTALDDAGLIFARYPVRSVADGTAIVVSGPPKMVGKVEALIESLPSPKAPPSFHIRERRGGAFLSLVPVDDTGRLVRAGPPAPNVVAAPEGATQQDEISGVEG